MGLKVLNDDNTLQVEIGFKGKNTCLPSSESSNKCCLSDGLPVDYPRIKMLSYIFLLNTAGFKEKKNYTEQEHNIILTYSTSHIFSDHPKGENPASQEENYGNKITCLNRR